MVGPSLLRGIERSDDLYVNLNQTARRGLLRSTSWGHRRGCAVRQGSGIRVLGRGNRHVSLIIVSSTFVQVSTMPSWLQPSARYQPVGEGADTVPALTQGGSVSGSLWPAFA